MNEVCFEGLMHRPTIKVWSDLFFKHKGKKLSLEGAYHPTKKWLYLHYKAECPIETLYHEMCHQYLADVLGDTKTHHGPIYWNVYNKGLELLEKHVRKIV